MDHREWTEFLKQWSRELIAIPEIAANVPPEAIDQGWLGFPPATDGQIMAAEQRLGALLPPSYKQFLRVTNRWRFTSFAIHHLFSTDELEWLRDNDPGLISSWREGAHLLDGLSGGPNPRQ